MTENLKWNTEAMIFLRGRKNPRPGMAQLYAEDLSMFGPVLFLKCPAVSPQDLSAFSRFSKRAAFLI